MSLHQPPEFLRTPGKPAIPWTQTAFSRIISWHRGATSTHLRAVKLCCCTVWGVEGQRLYYALPHTAGKKESGTSDEYDAAVATLAAYFTSKMNVVVERHRFGQRTQLPGETAASFVTALRELALTCNFGPAAATGDEVGDFDMACSEDVACRCSSIPQSAD
ncbi:hypothetical protein MTO96_016594 [Rhipicephalus appendiculatus]